VLRGVRTERFEVQFYRARQAVGRVGRTDATGRFVIQVETQGEGTLFASRENDVRYALLRGVSPGGGPYELDLVRGLEISGRVPSSGRAVVRVQGPFGHVVRVQTEDDGSFRIRGLPPGPYGLWCWKKHEGEHTQFIAEGVEPGSQDVVLSPR